MRAIIREAGDALAQCTLTFIFRAPIDVGRAAAQHASYCKVLERADINVEVLPADDRLPDAVFVEDAAVVLDEVAVITRPGNPARRKELNRVAEALARYRRLVHIHEPGTLEGGDVLRIGREYYVGLSTRTNGSGVQQFAAIAARFGYRVTPVEVRGCLHLKTAVTAIAPDTVLVNPAWIDTSPLAHLQHIVVGPEEPFAANSLLLRDTVYLSGSWPRTRERLEEKGFKIETIDVSEFEKAEAGLTCLSLIFRS